MIFIDLENNAPNIDWINRADTVTQSLVRAADHAARKVIIEANEGLWGELKGYLSKIRNRKCWYSESINDGAHCHVDHFRPKLKAVDENKVDQGGYWWLAFNWLNYRYAGPAVNVRKKDYFPVVQNKANRYGDNIAIEDILLLDPINISDPSKLAYDSEGRVSPRFTDPNSRDYKRAFYSIEKYNLNLEGLKEGRRQKYSKTTLLILKIQSQLALQVINHDLARDAEIARMMKELRDLAHPDSEYSASVKFCLKSCGHDWASDLLMAA
ncbi:hypothetical protein PQ469_27870 [Mucilaginibacter sp. KACC 22773]|uniref:hypothetical protein n=1 Tax=Mucilaginibacter sp. KACC 22773 TaxID=3025671 RepID=UPI002365B0D1|nr:hypothetical protein [Mucilaginibacter sp. KACC 22773]WDF77711.1 hypothetical protein PQ469_27870 [Mucilaginibacter sp. KACC 22773]